MLEPEVSTETFMPSRTYTRVDADFWRGRRVLLTGHTGFKGSWLSLWLQHMGAVLRGVSLSPPTRPSLFEAAGVGAGMDHRLVDIRDFESVKAHVEGWQPEVVIHMAAQPLVRVSYRNPVDTYATNVMGTVNVLEAARTCSAVKVIVNVTSDKCYDNHEQAGALVEENPMGGQDPYSSSKGCAELVSAAYRHSFLQERGIALATARAGNVIGGGDWAFDRLVPDVLRCLEAGQPILIRSPSAVRPWQHVLEPLAGYLILAQQLHTASPEYQQGWNFGPRSSDVRTVQWVVEKLCGQWGAHAGWTLQPGFHPKEAHWLSLDISKVCKRLGWWPRWSIEQALELTVEWHRAWMDGGDAKATCLEQIQTYVHTAEGRP
jgi:CDP-glucose 4,6-dehydratase